jgi:nucleoside-diphosphate-sugar epimerase
LLAAEYDVTVLDLFLYGDDVLSTVAGDSSLRQIRGDLRNVADVKKALCGVTDVVHLACISNDPSFELNPELGRSINFTCFGPLVDEAKAAGVSRFIYASSSSVYGVRDELNVTEDLALRPLTEYSKYKALCEEVLDAKRESGFTAVTIRPATVCGYSPRLRLDLTVNILTNHAVTNGVIRVFGGQQMRPNIHIGDMTDLYLAALGWPQANVDGRVYNAAYDNKRVIEIAESVRTVVGKDVRLTIEASEDTRSYHISSAKLAAEQGFLARRTVEDAIQDIVAAFSAGLIVNSMKNSRYYNIKTMQASGLL